MAHSWGTFSLQVGEIVEQVIGEIRKTNFIGCVIISRQLIRLPSIDTSAHSSQKCYKKRDIESILTLDGIMVIVYIIVEERKVFTL